MRHIDKQELAAKNTEFQINLIQSLLPASPVGLISTFDSKGTPNIAIFNKVMVLGSRPPLLGVVLRPLDRQRDTYQNINMNGRAAWNAFTMDQINAAHNSAQHFDTDISEFEACDLPLHYEENDPLPYLKDSPVRIDLVFVEEHLIQTNKTRLLVFEMKQFFIHEDLVSEEGSLMHHRLPTCMSVGQNGYTEINSKARKPD